MSFDDDAAPLTFANVHVTERQRRTAGWIALAMLAVAGMAIGFGRTQGNVVPSVLAALMGAIVVTEVLSASLLFNQFLASRFIWLAIVASGFLFVGLSVVGYLLTFPGVFSSTGFFGANVQTAVTLWCIWHAGFPIALIASVVAKHRRLRVPSTKLSSMLVLSIAAGCALVVALCVYFVSKDSGALPVLLGHDGFPSLMARGLLTLICALDIAVLLVLLRQRAAATVEVWLPVAVLASMLDVVMGALDQRYSLVWYTGKFFALTSSSIVLVVFFTETAKLPKALASTNRELQALRRRERDEAEARLEYLAHHDPITGLPNRTLLEDRLQRALLRSTENRRHTAVIHVNLDRFKTISEAMGLAAGEQLLREVAQRLAASVRRQDTVACIGGDEFAILLADIELPDDIAVAAHDVLEHVRPTFTLNGHPVFPSASIGVSIYPDDGTSVERLLRGAEAAADIAKRDGGNQLRFYRPAMHDAALKLIEMEADLRAAMEQRQFLVFYQPIFDVASGEIVCAEALLRWQHPRKGMLGPDAFIPSAEQSGIIVPIGTWVLDEVVAQIRRWQTQGIALPVAVNVSVREFQDAPFFERLSAALCRHGIKPEVLTIEITESLAIDDAQPTRETLARCRELGVGISLDDFGTSHACLANIKRLPITTLKIDKSFIAGVATSRTDAGIATAILSLAQSLGLDTIAEGVETQEQLEWLRATHCEMVQGYLLGRPMPAADLEARLRRDQRSVSA